jgi:hypothetical protein
MAGTAVPAEQVAAVLDMNSLAAFEQLLGGRAWHYPYQLNFSRLVPRGIPHDVIFVLAARCPSRREGGWGEAQRWPGRREELEAVEAADDSYMLGCGGAGALDGAEERGGGGVGGGGGRCLSTCVQWN